jgi:purine-cytosine permease-like protein
MKPILVAFLIGAVLGLKAQSYVEQRPDGLWLVFTNTPAKWQMSWSTNLSDWTPYLRKESLAPAKAVEVQISGREQAQFWRLEPLP